MLQFIFRIWLTTHSSSRTDERGQSTVEYALVILGAVALASLLIAWATGTGAIGTLFSKVIDKVLSAVE